MVTIETPLLIVGPGPAALVAAKVASGSGLACLVAGHETLDQHDSVQLDEQSLAILEPHGVLGVLRPYATSQQPFTIAPNHFERGLKHHCVADMLITVYDNISMVESVESVESELGRTAVLTDGRTRWQVVADAFFDTGELSTDFNGAIHAGSDFANGVLRALLH